MKAKMKKSAVSTAMKSKSASKPMMRKGGMKKPLPKAQAGTPWQQYLKTYPKAAATDTLPQGYPNSTNPAGSGYDWTGQIGAAENASNLTWGTEDTGNIMNAAQERAARAKAGNYRAGVPPKKSGGTMYKKGGTTKGKPMMKASAMKSKSSKKK